MPNELQKVVNKIKQDENFRTQLAQHPRDALKSLGITPTDAQVQAFLDSAPCIQKIWDAFGVGPSVKPLS